jgi:hypothetical protein
VIGTADNPCHAAFGGDASQVGAARAAPPRSGTRHAHEDGRLHATAAFYSPNTRRKIVSTCFRW